MKDVPSIQGVPDPRRPSEIHKESNIDPEKFKKILRVDESDETQKRHKRRKTKQEEEDEEIEENENDKQSVPEDFNKFLETPKDSDSVFQPQEGKKPTVSVGNSNTETSSQSPYNMISAGTKAPIDVPKEDVLVIESSSPTKEAKKENPEKKKAEEIITAIKEKKEKEEIAKYQKEHGTKELARTTIQTKEDDLFKIDSKESEKPSITLEHLKELSSNEGDQPLFREKSEKKDDDEKKSEEITSFEPQTAKASTKSVEGKTEETKTEEAMIKTSSLASPKKDHEKNETKDDEKEKKKDSADAPAPMPAPLPEVPSTPISAPVPSYAMLPEQVFDLFERLVGLLMIQNTKGVSTTTVTLNMPGSLFDGCKIKMEHYETAPHAYNLQMMGNPKAVALFNSNLTDLAAAFAQNKYSFSVNIKKPVLSEDFRYKVRRKESASDENSGEQEAQD